MTKTNQKLVIIYGNAIIHRSFHALPPTMTTKSGQVVNAVYGFTTFLIKALTDLKPDYIVLTLDRKETTFRRLEYKEYKAQRVKAPDELYEQIPLVKEVAKAFDIPIYDLAGYEADDLIGTISRQVNSDIKKIIMTGDMDTLQLINDHTQVYAMSRGITDSVLYSAKEVEERYGLKPEQMIDYKALRGDVSDNIPGVKGIGEKTASELLNNFKTLDKVYDAVDRSDEKIKPRILGLLKDHKEEAYLSQKLATIDLKTPIKFDLEASRCQKLDKDKIIALFSELEFKSLASRLNNLDAYLLPAKDQKPEEPLNLFTISDKFARDEREFKYKLIDSDADFKIFLKTLSQQKIFSLDTETNSLDPFDATLLGISFSFKEGEAYYLNINNKNTHWLKELAPILEDKNIKKCGHNIKFDLRILSNQGVKVNGVYFDTMIASYLLNPENRQHNLDAITFAEFSFEKISHKDLLGEKFIAEDFANVPLQKMATYSCEDADFTFRLVTILEKKLKTEKLWDLFQNIEVPLIPVLAKMEDEGILLDKKILSEMSKELKIEVAKLEKEIHNLAGEKFNIKSTKQLKEVLYEKLAIATKGIKKTKTGLSTAADQLEKLKDAHPIIPLLQNYRELTKLLSTYIEALPDLVNKKTKRLHTSFNQTITATGRLSSADPNLQNIPTKTALGKKIREAFVAEKGYILASLDYSQIELRLVAHMSADKRMLEAFTNNEDIHRITAAAINEVELDEVTSKMRSEAKAVNFGVIYGQGPHGLSQGAGIPYQKAQEFIAKYFETYSGIKKYIATNLEFAKKHGYVETLLGRRRNLPEINSSIVMIQKSAERMAINMPFQGTAADMIKLAMIKVAELIEDKDDIKMILQVHDELIFEIKKESIKKYISQIKAIMENIIELKVPIIADTKVGLNWGEMK
ncbi:MAG: DNA polymerase I [Candidatus Falkowbacteria bacterium]